MLYAYIGRLPNSGTTNFHTLSRKILSWNFEGTDVWNSLLHHPITSVTESQPQHRSSNRKIEKHNKHYKPHSHAGIRRNKSDWNIRKNHSYLFSLCEEGNGGIQEEGRSVWYLRNWISDHGRGYAVLSNRTHVGYNAKSC